MSHNSYIQIPPDSTGRRIRSSRRFDATVTNLRNITVPLLEVSRSTITGAVSGTTAKLTGVRSESNLIVFYFEHLSGTFTQGEALIDEGNEIADFQEGVYVDTQEVGVIDPFNPANHLKIARNGSAYVRFLEGNQTFGAFGVAETAPIQNLDEYTFSYSSSDELFKVEESGGGSSTHNPQESTLRLITNTAAGAHSSRTTRRYFPYLPGQGSKAIFSLALGDSGKENVRRRWGMFDEEDGVFFQEINGELSAVIRSNVSGTPVETVVTKSEFNQNRLENEETDIFSLTPDRMNIFWIDYQWLGAGRVRFGCYAPDGTRLTMHIFENIGTNLLPYMTRGTLPLRVEIENLDATASSSELKVVCMVVQRQCADKHHFGVNQHYRTQKSVLSDADSHPLFSIRPTLLFYGVTNRTQFIPSAFESYIKSSPIRLDVYLNSTLVGDNFTAYNTSSGLSAAEIDVDATSFSGGVLYNSIYLKEGVNIRELETTIKDSVQLGLGGVEQPVFTITATKLDDGATTAELELLFRWFEAR